jgi:DNA repair exonuclease SbcCD ATPase subunit
MLLHKITLSDFKNYKGKHVFPIRNINLISGENGSGKSTLVLHSLLFVLFGYSESNLASLSTRELTNPNTYVEIELEYLGKQYIIKRSIPTNISITIDGIELTLANNQLKQAELDKLFRTVDYFRKFRMIDIKDSINILEEGQQGLRKTLISFNDYNAISRIRTRLLSKKSDREKLNKEDAVIYSHAPSEQRYELLGIHLTSLTENLQALDKEIRSNEMELNTISNKRSRVVDNKNNLTNQRNSIMVDASCPLCKQGLPKTTKDTLLLDIGHQLKEAGDLLNKIIENYTTQEEVVNYLRANKKSLIDTQTRLNRLRMRLEARLKQKQYVWTSKDVLVVKTAIDELDSFSTFFLTEKLKILEPLINTITKKIGFTVSFNITENGNFDIILNNNGVEYKYKDLSNGQRLLVTIAFQLALLMEKNDSGLIVADEGFSSLSDKNLELVIDLFKNSNFQLLFVVHRYTANDKAINTICLP